MQNENAMATDSATAEPIAATAWDRTADHHLERLQADAAASGTEQRHVIAAGMLDEGPGERILTVQPDGSHIVTFVPEGK